MRRPASSPLTALVAAGVATLLALAACGDTTDDESAAGCAPDDGRTVTVDIPEFSFEPDPVAIEACDAVVWSNAHDQAHTSTGDGDQSWNTGNLQPGDDGEAVRFEAAGSYTYRCALHPFMTGTVEVS